MPDSVDGFCLGLAYGQGRIQGSRIRMRGICIFLPAILENAFDVYNFSIILNHFDSDIFTP